MENVISRVETVERTRVESILPLALVTLCSPLLAKFESVAVTVARPWTDPLGRRIDDARPTRQETQAKNVNISLSRLVPRNDSLLICVRVCVYIYIYSYIYSSLLSFLLSTIDSWLTKKTFVCNRYIVDFSQCGGGNGFATWYVFETFLKKKKGKEKWTFNAKRILIDCNRCNAFTKYWFDFSPPSLPVFLFFFK